MSDINGPDYPIKLARGLLSWPETASMELGPWDRGFAHLTINDVCYQVHIRMSWREVAELSTKLAEEAVKGEQSELLASIVLKTRPDAPPDRPQPTASDIQAAVDAVILNPGATAFELVCGNCNIVGKYSTRDVLAAAESQGLVRRGAERDCRHLHRPCPTWWPIPSNAHRGMDMVVHAVTRTPGCTAAELICKMPHVWSTSETVRSTLAHAESLELVTRGDMRECTILHMAAPTWWPLHKPTNVAPAACPVTAQCDGTCVNPPGAIPVPPDVQEAVDAVQKHPGMTSRELAEAICYVSSERPLYCALGHAEERGLLMRGSVRKCRAEGVSKVTWWPVTVAYRACCPHCHGVRLRPDVLGWQCVNCGFVGPMDVNAAPAAEGQNE
jgi:hypothetical protein